MTTQNESLQAPGQAPLPQVSRGQEAIRAIATPLAGVDSRSLDALMAEDAEALADADVERIVAELRRVRGEWMKNEEAKASGTRVAKAKAPAGAKAKVTLELKDLGF